jgi:UPF0755 protein
VISAGIVVTLLLVAYATYQLRKPINLAGAELVYEVKPGASLNSIITDLVGRDIVKIPVLLFRVYALVTAGQGSLKAGEFLLNEDFDGRQVLLHFRQGQVIQHYITFPEGWRFTDWREHLAAQTKIRVSVQGLTEAEIMTLLGVSGQHIEGQFFPDTYQYAKGEADISILRRAHRRMTHALRQAWQNRADETLNSTQEALILASIIEKETGFAPDRGNIASVFINRLRQDMRLQTDPTVIYGLTAFDGDLTRAHLRQATPYNTYRNKGLPPTPICNPGLASIEAALNPASTTFLYFVAQGDGKSYFSTSLAEHNEAVRRFQSRAGRDGYRSTPLPEEQ